MVLRAFRVLIALATGLVAGCDAPLSAGRSWAFDRSIVPAGHKPVISSPAAAPVVRPPSAAGVALAPLIPERAVALIVSFEVGSPELYQRKYRNPIYPGGASGPTVGIGYDLGHTLYPVILVDWEASPHAARMATASGLKGEPKSREWVRRHADIAVEWGIARQVFDQTSLVSHYRIARRVFGPAFDEAPAMCRGAITSVVFNRGGSMKGPGRLEMRTIRDKCLPDGNMACVAENIRSMARINAGTPIAAGIARRRNAEAELCT